MQRSRRRLASWSIPALALALLIALPQMALASGCWLCNYSTVTASPTAVPVNGAATITVTLTDGEGPLSGWQVTLAAGAGSSIITTLVGITNRSGQASFSVTDAVPESVIYTARVTFFFGPLQLNQTATVSFAAAAPPPRVGSISLTGPAQVQVGGTATYSAAAISTAGAPMDAFILWSSTGGSITSAGVLTAPTVPGTYTVTAMAQGKTAATQVVVVHGPAKQVAISPAAALSLTAGQWQAFTYTATDAYGNAVADETPAWTSSGVGGVSSIGTFRSNAAGTAAVSVSVDGASATSGAISVGPAAPAQAVVTGPAAVHVFGTAQFTAAVSDSFGNAIPGASVTWSATGGTISDGGLFTAGNVAAAGSVTASVGTATGSAGIAVTAPATGTHGAGTASPGNSLVFSDQPLPAGVKPITAPVVISGKGTVTAQFATPGGGFTESTLAYYYDSQLKAWIAVPTMATPYGATAQVPAGVPVALIQGWVIQPIDTQSHWANGYVLELESFGWLSGFPDQTFRPDAAVTRYELAKVLALAAKLDVSNPDLSVLQAQADASQISAWARPYVAAALKAGLMKGFGWGFGGDLPLTRAEAATVLGRLLPGHASADLSQFTDSALIPDYAQDGISQAVGLGLMSGFADHTLRPGATLTRGELAKLLALGLQLLVK